MRRLFLMAVIAGFAASAPAQQSAAPVIAEIGAAQAQAVIAGCVDHATREDRSFAIAVVDRGGRLVAALRMDSRRWGMMDFAIEKAEAAAAWGFPTSGMEQGAQTTPGFAFAPEVVTVPGGVPIYDAAGRLRIGAVGVSGSAPAEDEICARAGIEAADLRAEAAE